jgi:hypothetical protein
MFPKSSAEPCRTIETLYRSNQAGFLLRWRACSVASDSAIFPVIELNRAVAIAMCEGAEQGLCLIDNLLARKHLSHYHLVHSARADLCRGLGRIPEARASYEKALAPGSVRTGVSVPRGLRELK